jgi:DNA-directed RNA polymerase subunit RPC12/RpoP
MVLCPRCSYRLNPSELLLCRTDSGYYCPRCWKETNESPDRDVSEVLPLATVVSVPDRDDAGADESWLGCA